VSEQGLHGGHERADRHRFGQIGIGAGIANALFIALAGIGRDGQHRDDPQREIGFCRLYQVQSGNIGQLDVHDDEIRHKAAGTVQRLAPIGDRFHREALTGQDIAEQLTV